MLDVQLIRDNPDRIREAIRRKGVGDVRIVDRLIEADRDRRDRLSRLQELQALANDASREIGDLMKEGRREEAQSKIKQSASLKDDIKSGEEAAREMESALRELLLEIPNVPHESVPVGSGAQDNVVLEEIGDKPKFDFDPLPHWEVSERHGLVDFERGSKVTGAGFPFYVRDGARLQRSLVAMMLDLAVSRGYTEVQPPLLVNAESATGTGQLPDKEDQMYEVGRDELFLVPTAEIPVTNYFRDEIIDEGDLPLKFCAYTACFRREAGSYGKEVRGLNRLHQFDKVELVQWVKPEASYDALEEMREDAEHVLEKLELPYRRLLMCTGDMGFSQAKKYDLEVWSAGQEKWLEVSSVSNYEAFQARRMRIRFKDKRQQKNEFVHTLNGSALALPRIVAALIENNLNENGTISIPAALSRYFGSDVIG